RLTTVRRGLSAVKPDLHGPAMHVRAFVVKEDRLIGGIRRCAVNVAAYARARQVAILAKQFIAHRTRHRFKNLNGAYVEPAPEHSAVTQQHLFRRLPVTRGPTGKIDVGYLRLGNEEVP